MFPLSKPIERAFSIEPHETDELPHVTDQIMVGVGGDLEVVLKGDESPIILKNVKSGVTLDLAVKRVISTHTTASGIIGSY